MKKNYSLTKRTIKKSNGTTDTQDCIVVDMKKLTKEEKEIVQMYVQAGYKVVKRRVPGNGVKKADIKKYIEEKGNKEQKDEFKRREKDKFILLRKWFFEQFPAYERELELKAEEEKEQLEQKKVEAIENIEKEYKEKAQKRVKNGNKTDTKQIEIS